MTNRHGGARLKTSAADQRGGARPGSGPKKKIEQIRLSIADADLLRSVAGDDLPDVLRRLAARAAADPAGTRQALAPLLAVAAWDGEEIL